MKRKPYLGAIISLIWILLLYIIEFLIAERNHFAALITYMPQHFFSVPILIIISIYLFKQQWIYAVANFVILGIFIYIFMGLNFPNFSKSKIHDFRVMTVNIKNSKGDINKLINSIIKEAPDIVLLQEANAVQTEDDIPDLLMASDYINRFGWSVERAADVAILCRHPMTNTRSIYMMNASERRILITETSIEGKKLTVATVHYYTNLNNAKINDGIRYLKGSAESRMEQTNLLINNLLDKSSLVFGGDFNMPPRGLAYSKLKNNFQDAFYAGKGFGYTFPSSFPIMRIDHLFSGIDIIPVSWKTLDTGGTDHLAIIADFAFK